MTASDQSIRERLSTWVETSKVPGLQYVVVTASGVVFESAAGSADLARRRAMTPDTTLMAYSMSKTVTAIAVLQLVEAGQIALDDRLTRTVPFSPYDPGVTIRQLLSHTSGLPNPIPLRWVHPADAHREFNEAEALRAVLQQHGRSRTAPGARYAYSNIGYWLLGSVVEQASGQRFADYVDAHVVRPLGLDAGQLGYDIADPARHAAGYLEKYSLMNLVKGLLIDRRLIGEYAGAWLEIRPHYPNGPAFGGVVGTARAFARLLQDQLQPHSVLLGASARQHLHEPQTTNTGQAVPMTLGWHIGELQGHQSFFKEGGGGGFHALMRVYPTAGIGTVLMTNATGFNVTRALDELDGANLGLPLGSTIARHPAG